MKEIIFRRCQEAESKAICGPDKFQCRHEGGTRQAEAAYTELLGVITEAGLQDEYDEYKKRRGGKQDAGQITGNFNAH